MRSGKPGAKPSIEFESRTAFRAAVERRLNRSLSDHEWAALGVDWEPPYDAKDVQDIASRAATLPSARATARSRLALDVERLQALIPPSGARDPSEEDTREVTVWRILGEALTPVVIPSEDRNRCDDAPTTAVYTLVGRFVFQCAAADWLARRHGIDSHDALRLLRGQATYGDPFERGSQCRSRSMKQLLIFAKFLRLADAHETGYLRGLRVGRKERLRHTDQLLVIVHDDPDSPSRWESRRQYYSEVCVFLASEPDYDDEIPRHFPNWRAFKVATQRALDRRNRLAQE